MPRTDVETASQPAGTRVLPAPRSRRIAAAGLLGLLVIGAVVGSLIGHSTRASAPSGPHSFVAAGNLSLSPAGTWRRVPNAKIAGLSLTNAVTLTDRVGASPEGLEIGTSSATGRPLLPVAFARGLTPRPRGDSIRLGRYTAYRYGALHQRASGLALTAYAVPTSRGVGTAVCFSRGTGSTAFMERCARAAATLQLTGVRPFDVGPDPGFAQRLNRVLSTLRPARAQSRARLAAAKTPAAQAVAASDLANLYSRAARGLPARDLSPELAPANQAIAAALGQTSAAYGALASAARQHNRGRYRAAAGRVAASDRAVAGALGQLQALGYHAGQ
jgi:hypothetical protein